MKSTIEEWKDSAAQRSLTQTTSASGEHRQTSSRPVLKPKANLQETVPLLREHNGALLTAGVPGEWLAMRFNQGAVPLHMEAKALEGSSAGVLCICPTSFSQPSLQHAHTHD
ncbi:hypothetical protein NQZ68_012243 [Dissostichus eleginoides]|nr:hypothetical protein NQZ68_012243 [Dissostichus eleginoides]